MENPDHKLRKLLKNYPADFADIVLDASRQMSKEKLRELYFVLNCSDKQVLEVFLKDKKAKLSQNLQAFKHLNTKIKKLGSKLKESNDREKDLKLAEKLIKNHG